MKYILGTFPYLFALVLFTSCSNNEQDETRKIVKDSASVQTFLFPINKFSLPYDSHLNLDSNSVIFMKEVPFDTSYLIHVRKESSVIRGVCYMILPSFHRDLEDFKDEKQKLLFFDGFSFILDSLQWETLNKKTKETLINMTDSIPTNSSCIHCPSYTLFYNHQRRATGNSKLQGNFKSYETYLREEIVDPLLKKRPQ